MRTRPILALALAALSLFSAGCGGGGGTTGGGDNGGGDGGNNGGNNGGGTPLPDGATVEGYAFTRQAEAETLLLAQVRVEAYTFPVGSVPIAVAQSNNRGRYVFSPGSQNPLPRNRTVLIRAVGAGRVVSAVVNTNVEVQTQHLNEATHLAALALVAAAPASVGEDAIARHETAAAARLRAGGATDFTLSASQAEAQAEAAQVAAEAAGLAANQVPTLTGTTLSPTQLRRAGGPVEVRSQAADAEGAALTVRALIWARADAPPQVVELAPAGGEWAGTFTAPPNDGPSAALLVVAIVADDGTTAPLPQAVTTVTVLPEGQITLDILAETLFDEPASRAAVDRALAVRRVRARHGRGARTRQVNPNQTLRGVDVVFDGQPDLRTQTGNDGLALLNVPLSAADDGVLSVTATLAGRAPYRQVLVLPHGVSVSNGDTIEIDLPLAPPSDWQTLASTLGLGTLDFARMPLLVAPNVQPAPSLGGATVGQTLFRPISSTQREDDGDWFATNVTPGTASFSGVYASPYDAVSAYPFGPVEVPLAAGTVTQAAALLPPQ